MVLVVIGPAGSGKSTVGSALARTLGWRFVDADALHAPENVARLRRGESLTDEQRAPWLAAVARETRKRFDTTARLWSPVRRYAARIVTRCGPHTRRRRRCDSCT